jgi:hypothetical protein
MIEAALKSLDPFALLQAVIAVLIVLVWSWMMFRGSRDKKSPNGAVPAWTLYGAAHEAMVAIHEMNEQSREANRILTRAEAILKEIMRDQREQREMQTQHIAKELREQTQLLEDIRNSQVLGNVVPGRRR